jgi:crossover junction endodeoxyribonuclease RusA
LFANSAVAVKILYLYEEAALDTDNVVKPILDALIDIVFPDDSAVSDIEVRRRWLRTTFALSDVSPILAGGLDLRREFIYVLIDQAPPQDVLP